MSCCACIVWALHILSLVLKKLLKQFTEYFFILLSDVIFTNGIFYPHRNICSMQVVTKHNNKRNSHECHREHGQHVLLFVPPLSDSSLSQYLNFVLIFCLLFSPSTFVFRNNFKLTSKLQR